MTKQQCFPYIHDTKNLQITPRFLKDGDFFFFNNQLANLQFKTFLWIKYDKILIIFHINPCKNRSLVKEIITSLPSCFVSGCILKQQQFFLKL